MSSNQICTACLYKIQVEMICYGSKGTRTRDGPIPDFCRHADIPTLAFANTVDTADTRKLM